MKRVAGVIKPLPHMRSKYLELHGAVWPGVREAMRKANISNYTIFLPDDLLFSYHEYLGIDLDRDLASLEKNSATRRLPGFAQLSRRTGRPSP